MARSIWVADSETEGFKYRRIPRPFIWGAYDGSTYREFNTTAEFLDFFRELDVIVYAHNGGKFDWMYLLDELEPWEPIMVINGRLAKFKIGNCEFRDSYNILPMPLAAYKKDEIDYALFEPEERAKPENMIKIRDYLRSDCLYLYQLVSDFANNYGGGLTLAGSAMKQWQKIADRKAPSTSEDFYNTFSPYYYGGRVECFRLGIVSEPFKVIDINSAYPFAMKHNHAYGDAFTRTAELPKSRAYTERSFIHLRGVSRGALPYRAADKSLEFPNDNEARDYHVTGWEFLAAIETRSLDDWEIISVTTFLDSINFVEYVDHFYEMKSSAEKGSPEYIFAKLFLNSLYGKFGANPDKYDEYTVIRPQFIDAANVDGYDFCADLGKYSLVSRPLSDERRRYYNLATAASVTGFVRAYLWRAIKDCKGVIYCDTDSIACADSGALALDPNELGAWDTEAVCDHGGVAGKKLYAFHTTAGKWKKASKGVRLSPEEILGIAAGKDAIYRPEAPSFSIKNGAKIFGAESETSANLDKLFQIRKIKGIGK